MITSTQDVLITPSKPVKTKLIQFLTDLLVIRGAYSKLSLCVYGNLVDPSCANLWLKDAPINETGMAMEMYDI
jgi:hypothetical protein